MLYGREHIRALGPTRLDRETVTMSLGVGRILQHLFQDRSPARPEVEIQYRCECRGDVRQSVTIDGGGWNVLRRWPKSWPELRRAGSRAPATMAYLPTTDRLGPSAITRALASGRSGRESLLSAWGIRTQNTEPL